MDNLLIHMKNFGFIIGTYIKYTHNLATSLAILVILDIITGIMASAKVNGFSSITSKRLLNDLLSKILILLAPFTLALACIAIDIDLRWLIKSFICVIALSEAYSIVGNIYTFSTGVKAPKYDVISFMLTKIREVLNSLTKQ